ncbi:MAG: nitroreductase family protein [Clostridia bacterium]|nr:nitroreductase family protein [Clostridia bacterium]
MQFDTLIKERQSCRNFSDKFVSKDLLYKIIASATNAPSACNSQPWRVFVTNTPEENAKMKSCLQNGGKNKFLDKAQAFIAVFGTEIVKLNAGTESKFDATHFVEYDIGEFVAYLTLAAKDNGLDSCIIGWVNNDEINAAFSVNGKCDIVVALGYAEKDKPREKSRKHLEEIIINYEK